MIDAIKNLSKKYKISVVGGGTLKNITTQLGIAIEYVEYIFSENGTVVYKGKDLINKLDLRTKLGEVLLKRLINFLLKYMSNLDLPFKRGTFIEFRTGLLNISPVGRNCTLDERELFAAYDKENKILKTFKETIENEFKDEQISICYGGKISIDLYPTDWSKALCLSFLDQEAYDIIFFGDKIYEGGNDYDIAIDKRVSKYFKVSNPNHTIELLAEYL